MGLSIPEKLQRYPKENTPTFLFVGRIAKTKGIENTIETLRLVRQTLSSCRLWIVGQGYEKYSKMLRDNIRKLQLDHVVQFFGFVSERRKFELMARAHVLLVPSLKEGWGLIVPEASYVGTPSVAYNVAGLRDIIQNGKNGMLTDTNPSAMAKAATLLLQNNSLYKKIQFGAAARAREFRWDETAHAALSVIERTSK
jgi:glycosyltransferase involved in cell wall biosynthesis